MADTADVAGTADVVDTGLAADTAPVADTAPAADTGPAAATTARALLVEGRRRYEAGDYADAEPLARRALELLSTDAGADRGARSAALQLVGECAFSLGRYRNASDLADEALALRADPSGATDEDATDEPRASDIDIAESLNLRGIVDLALGDHESGYERVARGLSLREAALGPDAQDTLESLNNTGVALGRLGRMAEAIAVHEEALRRCERASAEPTRELAVTCNALAVKLDDDDTTRDRATELYRRALEAAEAALGPEHPMVATLTSNIGTGRLNAGDLNAARPLLERALALHERRHGPRHPNTATVLTSLATLEVRQGRPSDARVHADRALAIRLEAFGFGDKRTVQVIAILVPALGALIATDADVRGDAVAMLGVLKGTALGARLAAGDVVRMGEADPARAEQTLRAYLDRVAEREPAEDADVRRLRDRARMAAVAADSALMAGQPDTAAFAASAAIAHLEAASGHMSLELIEPLHRASAIERARHDDRRAVALERRALDILALAYGDSHPFVLKELALLANTEVAMGDRDAARRDLLRIRAALAGAEQGGLAAHVRDVVEQRLRALDGGRRLS